MLGRLNEKSKSLTRLIQSLDVNDSSLTPEARWFSIVSHADIKMINRENVIAKIYRDIIALRFLIDETHGIHSFLCNDPELGEIWIRRVNQASLSQPPLSQRTIEVYNCLRLFYAYMIAAIVVAAVKQADTSIFLELILQVKHLISDAFHQAIDNDNDCFAMLAEGKAYLIEVMGLQAVGSSNADIDNWLDHAKDWVAMESAAIPVLTLIETTDDLQKMKIIIYDEPVCQMTDDQRALMNDFSSQCWFRELNPFQQSLAQYYRDAILKGDRVIPSQLRAILPFSKNAFLQSVWVAARGDQVDLLNAYYHTGTIAYVSHKNKQQALQITKANYAQQKLVSGVDQVLMICLNSSMSDRFMGTYEWLMRREYVADDSEIITLTSQAASQLANNTCHYAKLCVNQMRYIEYNDYGGIDKILSIVKSNLSLLNQTDQSVSDVMNELNQLISLEWQLSLLDLDVKGLDIIHRLTKVVTLNNRLKEYYPHLPLVTVSVWFGCASGENRTGITYYHVISSTLTEFFKQHIPSCDGNRLKDHIFSLIAASQHVLVVTGHQGSTFGTEGIRNKSIGTFKASHPKERLLTKTSELKKVAPESIYLSGFLNRLSRTIESKRATFEDKQRIDAIMQLHALVSSSGTSLFLMNRVEHDLILTVLKLFERTLLSSPDASITADFSVVSDAILQRLSNENPTPSTLFVSFANAFLKHKDLFLPIQLPVKRHNSLSLI